ncbi:ABC transporter permease [Phytohabitans houttuyneae]|jgi:NitT/TauT family transport system permease protein|uniref:ABC transporter permease n=1 Tax=Phytohabitans houttuyneae TaxID=1076126 RepID=A0A6V8KAI8_9ACTN|nr:ABC transporter permease [Phytohabitans houttuyneae]GFJ78966.1 ABC transporter permease [Phytohabitans houttuyneae]
MSDTSVAAPPVAVSDRSRVRVPAIVYPLAGFTITVFTWWLVTTVLGLAHPVVLPPPQDVLRGFNENRQFVLEGLLVTALETVIGFVISSIAGFFIGLMLASSSLLERMFSPLLVAVNAVPKIALGPMLVAWLGWGQPPIQFMIFVMCFFPVVLSTVTGLTRTPAELAEMARSLDASRAKMFLKVRLPAALPQVFVGLKLALPLAAVGAIIGEFQAGDAERPGLGSIIQQTLGQGQSSTAFAAFVLIASTTIVLYYLLVGLERLLLPWVRATTDR